MTATVLLTSTAYPPSYGGAQLYAHYIAQNLKPDFKAQVVAHWDENRSDWLWGTTIRAPHTPKDYEIDGVPVHRIGISRQRQRARIPLALAYYGLQDIAIKRFAGDIVDTFSTLGIDPVLVHNIRAGRAPLSYASLNFARNNDIPFVFTPLHHPRWTTWFHRHYLALYKKADALLAMTEHERRVLHMFGVEPDRIHVIGTGPVVDDTRDPAAFRQEYGITGRMVLFLGQKYPYKNYDALLKAAPVVWQTHPDVTFFFMGPRSSHSERLFRDVRDPRIIEVGWVNSEEKTNALAACDLLCMPSSQESFGSVFLEAWACEKPVIGGDAPAVKEVITHGVDGLVSLPTADDLASAIRLLLDDPEMARSFGQAGKRKGEERYTWEKISAKVKGVYYSLTG